MLSFEKKWYNLYENNQTKKEEQKLSLLLFIKYASKTELNVYFGLQVFLAKANINMVTVTNMKLINVQEIKQTNLNIYSEL